MMGWTYVCVVDTLRYIFHAHTSNLNREWHGWIIAECTALKSVDKYICQAIYKSLQSNNSYSSTDYRHMSYNKNKSAAKTVSTSVSWECVQNNRLSCSGNGEMRYLTHFRHTSHIRMLLNENLWHINCDYVRLLISILYQNANVWSLTPCSHAFTALRQWRWCDAIRCGEIRLSMKTFALTLKAHLLTWQQKIHAQQMKWMSEKNSSNTVLSTYELWVTVRNRKE